MANQYTTGQGQGVGPMSQDPKQRFLASGVNSGQGLQNMDPGKTPDPYAGAAGSVAQNVTRGPAPAPTPNPYAPHAQTATAPAATPTTAPASAPAPAPLAPSQAMGQPPNPYMPRATAAAPAAAPTPAPAAGGAWQPDQPTQFNAPNEANPSVFNPTQFSDYGKLLLGQAQGQLTPAQQMADKQNFFDQYYGQGGQAAEQSAGRGIGGVTGASREMQNSIAGNIANAMTTANANRATAAQEQYGQLLGQGMQQSEFEQGLNEQQKQLEQQAEASFNSTMATLSGQQSQQNIEQQKIDQQNKQPFLNALGTVFGNGATAFGKSIFG